MSHPSTSAPRWPLLGTVLCLIAAAGPLARTALPVESQAMTPMSAEARAELAPSGRLRAALNYSNFLLVSTRAPEHAGVAPDLARELARRANATVEFVGYENAGLVADGARNGAWDVAFIGAEPARAGEIAFTPAYVEIEATYLLPADSPLQPGYAPIRSVEDVDREGMRIATTARAAYTLYLQRTLRHATLVEAETIQGAFDLFTRSNLDALAGLTPRLLEDAKQIPGARVLAGRFTAVQQALGVRKERASAAAYLTAFVQEIKTSGLLGSLIERHEARGLSIAGPAR
jgi:polar amino acid transport system substrate-binding protein